MYNYTGRRVLWLVVLLSVLLCARSVCAFVEIEAYDPADGSYLGRFASPAEQMPFRDAVLLKVTPTTAANKIRLEPLNSDCGTERLTLQQAPYEFLVHPLSSGSRCVLQFVGWQSPWSWVGSQTVAMSFNPSSDIIQPDLAPELAQLELYNLDTNEYLGTVEQGVAAIPFAEVIGVRVPSSQGLDWVRLIPTNDYCGQRRRFDSSAPFQLKVFAESENRPCEFIVQGYKNPRSMVGATPVTIIFDNTAVTSGR